MKGTWLTRLIFGFLFFHNGVSIGYVASSYPGEPVLFCSSRNSIRYRGTIIHQRVYDKDMGREGGPDRYLLLERHVSRKEDLRFRHDGSIQIFRRSHVRGGTASGVRDHDLVWFDLRAPRRLSESMLSFFFQLSHGKKVHYKGVSKRKTGFGMLIFNYTPSDISRHMTLSQE